MLANFNECAAHAPRKMQHVGCAAQDSYITLGANEGRAHMRGRTVNLNDTEPIAALEHGMASNEPLGTGTDAARFGVRFGGAGAERGDRCGQGVCQNGRGVAGKTRRGRGRRTEAVT
jgi:hypothetical protein